MARGGFECDGFQQQQQQQQQQQEEEEEEDQQDQQDQQKNTVDVLVFRWKKWRTSLKHA